MGSDQHAERSGRGRPRDGSLRRGQQPREARAKPGRARQRAIRAHAAAAGVPYSVAARQLDGGTLRAGETLAVAGRTVYPTAVDGGRRWSLVARARRPQADRIRDARRAADLPDGRAEHLVQRFPPGREPARSGVGPLYQGPECRDLLAMLYVVLAADLPQLVPAPAELAWIAGLGEETSLDLACSPLDRCARRLLAEDPAQLWCRVEDALAAAERSPDGLVAAQGRRLRVAYQTMMTPRQGGDDLFAVLPPIEGARQILDALLVGTDGGHAPGTQVRLLLPEVLGRHGTIIGLVWGVSGPPVGYRVTVHGVPVHGVRVHGVRVHGTPVVVAAAPEQLIVPGGQECDHTRDLSLS